MRVDAEKKGANLFCLHFLGLTIKICYDDPGMAEDKTLYTEDDFRDFLTRRGWTGLREFPGFRNEFTAFRTFDTLDELRPGCMYQGARCE